MERIVQYLANPSKSAKADPRFSIDPDGLETFNDRPAVEFTGEDGEVIRLMPPRNVYIPGGEDVESVTFTVTAETVTRASTPKGSASHGAADPVLSAMIATGDVDALALHLATMRGSTRAAKVDTIRAKALIG